jgi:hypothetical protein
MMLSSCAGVRCFVCAPMGTYGLGPVGVPGLCVRGRKQAAGCQSLLEERGHSLRVTGAEVLGMGEIQAGHPSFNAKWIAQCLLLTCWLMYPGCTQ